MVRARWTETIEGEDIIKIISDVKVPARKNCEAKEEKDVTVFEDLSAREKSTLSRGRRESPCVNLGIIC